MELVKNAWYVCAWPHEVTQTALLARKICGESLVLFRDGKGAAVALEDRCCHRELPLSKGWLEDGSVRCGYHGLLFDAQGACTECPMQEKIPPDAKVRAYPTVEKHGWVWVYTGKAQDANPADIPAMFAPNDHPDWTSGGGTTFVNGNYQLISDNLLDLTHETYIHRTSLGSRHVVEHPIEVKREGQKVVVSRFIPDHDPAPFWKARLFDKLGRHVNVDRWQVINFMPPSHVVLEVGVAPAGSGALNGDRSAGVEGCNLNAITPADETSTWYFWAFARKFCRDDAPLTEKITSTVASVFEEDREAIEAVQQVMNANPGRPTMSLTTDRGQMLARALVKDMANLER
jgi:vanillate O-demethylase monooxygenase subunit